MRLIDADDVICLLTNRLFETLKTQIPCVTTIESKICLDTCYKIAKYEIDNIDTAYDINKVIEELDNQIKTYQIYNPPRDDYESGFENGCEIGFNKAIEIVKAGTNNDNR